MKLSDAFNRLRFTLSKGNKPNQTDIDAFNEIGKYFALHQKDIIQDNLLFAKLYAFTLSELLTYYSDVDFANKELNKVLSEPICIEKLRLCIKTMELRLNISAPSGAGKTYSALRMANGLCGDWSKVAVIDTENGSASLYSHLGEFNTIDLTPPFTPEKYIEAINACVAGGMEAIIIDSSTHEWACLIEENELLAQSKFR